MRLILASKSPARKETLRRAGLRPEILVSGVDEDQITADTPAALALLLADLKAAAVIERLTITEPTALVACDSLLEFAGKIHGKPGSADQAIARWYLMRGQSGVLHTGHHVSVWDAEGRRHTMTRLASTTVTFADLSDAEIAAYAATGEPERVAGAFTTDGYGGAFVTRMEGDPHNVVGLSLPLLRQMLLDLGVPWHTLWTKVGRH
ncbi:septum formation inhibitor Maf [Tessaracoccus sp. SD287]|uniref:Maf family protein n=1 Tax=Tessaracoccus sp. SD287 TaxID=2782008 RepID=UPI001A975EA1|nr:septum formation inhibitor Maf [Tessaracoccus sp. SD287]